MRTPHVRRYRSALPLASLAAAAVLLAGCSGSDPEGSAEEPAASESATNESPEASEEVAEEAPDPSKPGTFSVGRRTETVIDATREDRTFGVEVWYPADAEGTPTPYELIPGVSFDSDLSEVGAAPSAEAPFPLVVFSHGSGGLRTQSASIMETIASHGFTVVAPDHVGNTAIDQILGSQTPPPVTARNRVADVSLLLDRVDSGEVASGLTDTENVAVMGHSFGGFTALASAGGYAKAEADPRVDAIVPLAPFSELLSKENLSSISVPMLVITGSDDETTPVENQSTRPVELAGGESELILIDGADHQAVTNVCDIVEALEKAGDAAPAGAAQSARQLAGGGCNDKKAIKTAFDVTEHYAVAFLKSMIGGDDRYADIGTIKGATVQN